MLEIASSLARGLQRRLGSIDRKPAKSRSLRRQAGGGVW